MTEANPDWPSIFSYFICKKKTVPKRKECNKVMEYVHAVFLPGNKNVWLLMS